MVIKNKKTNFLNVPPCNCTLQDRISRGHHRIVILKTLAGLWQSPSYNVPLIHRVIKCLRNPKKISTQIPI